MKTEADIVAIIHKQLTNQLLPQEEEVLEEWLEEDDRHQQLFEEIRLSWQLAIEDAPEVRDDEVEQELGRLLRRVDRVSEDDTRRNIELYKKSGFYKNLAIIFLLVMSGWMLYQLNKMDDLPKEPAAAIVVKKEDGFQEIMLPDSSRIFTNGTTHLSYDQTSQRRVVNLSGIAFFEVARDERRPFLIYLEQATIRVLGTSFFVKALTGESLEVIVESGSVEVLHKDQIFQLKKGEKLKISPGKEARKECHTDPNYLSWKNKKLLFHNAPLREVLPTLERHYGISIRVEDPAVLGCRFTGTFEAVPLEELLEILSYSLQLSVEWQGERRLRLAGNSCD
jgi:transmembrane sensor